MCEIFPGLLLLLLSSITIQASDTDNSGELSEDEFFDIVDRIGLSLSVRQKVNAMSLYDADHSGAIQLDEFKDFINEVEVPIFDGITFYRSQKILD